jgi:polyisoprenoid-binding protein YceI
MQVRRMFAVSLALATPLALVAMSSPSQAAVKAGTKCPKAGSVSGKLTCAKKAGRLVWSRSAAAGTATKAADSAPPASTGAGIDGSWKATAESKVGYRAKEVLFGEKTEGVGQTNGVTGTLTISGTKVTEVALSADLTTLKSDSGKRDSQVQGRILETAKFPTATLKLLKPIDFGKIPADGAEVKQKGSVEMTLHGVTKPVDVEVSARLKGGKIEIAGALPLVWNEWGIADPGFAGQIVVEPNGLMEFLVVFAK